MEDKPWGSTQIIFANHYIQVNKIIVNPLSYSSLHLHEHKYNIFSIVSGELEIYCQPGVILDKKHVLNPEGLTCVEISPGVRHRFYSKEGAEAYEIYILKNKQLSSIPKFIEDIIRFTPGGTTATNHDFR